MVPLCHNTRNDTEGARAGCLELLHAIVQHRPMPVHEVRRDVPLVLSEIINKVGPSSVHSGFLLMPPAATVQESGRKISECTWLES